VRKSVSEGTLLSGKDLKDTKDTKDKSLSLRSLVSLVSFPVPYTLIACSAGGRHRASSQSWNRTASRPWPLTSPETSTRPV